MASLFVAVLCSAKLAALKATNANNKQHGIARGLNGRWILIEHAIGDPHHSAS